MNAFVAPTYDHQTERRLAIKLWTAFHAHAEAGRKIDRVHAWGHFNGMASVAAGILGYGMTPFAVELAIRDTYCAHVRDHGPMPSALDQGGGPTWCTTLTESTVAALRGIR